MKGIDPPSPNVRAGRPNAAVDASSSATASHGAVGGAFHPGPNSTSANDTRAPYGGSDSSAFLTAAAARHGSQVGGVRKDSFSDVRGRSTLPARAVGGRPSAPITVSAGPPRARQQLLGGVIGGGRCAVARTDSGRRSRPISAAVAAASATRSAGIATFSSGTSTAPVATSSTRSSRAAGDAEGVGHHAADVAGVQPVGDDVDRERAGHEAAQRRGHPEPVVVDAPGVETDHEAGCADPIRQRLDVGGQIGRTGLFTRLDQHHTASVRSAGDVDRFDRGQAANAE